MSWRTWLLAGLALMAVVVARWWAASFGALDYRAELRFAIPGATCCLLGLQTVMSSFVLGLARLSRR